MELSQSYDIDLVEYTEDRLLGVNIWSLPSGCQAYDIDLVEYTEDRLLGVNIWSLSSGCGML
jgi:hypothetical protein